MSKLAVLGVAIAASILGGWQGWLYTAAYVFAVLPGWPVGAWLFGRAHPAAWMTGALAGYGLAGVGLWLLRPLSWTGLALWMVLGIAGVAASLRQRRALVQLPGWRPSTTAALSAVLLTTTVLVALPLARVGEVAPDGQRRYRAYFTADFVWHEALTAELARVKIAPHNPYFAHEPLSYYWAYFVLPSTAARQVHPSPGPAAPIELYLKINAFWTALLLMSAIFLAAWVATPRGWAAGVATVLTLTASSAEGLYAAIDTWRKTESFWPLRDLNVDAITYWWFGGLTIDGLVRALWYNPQHSAACALGLTALVVAIRARRLRAPAVTGTLTGVLLGAALVMSPFPGGAMAIVVAGTVGWQLLTRAVRWRSGAALAAGAVAPLAAALWWLVSHNMAGGAAQAVSLGLSAAAMHNVVPVLTLAIGPLLVLVAAGAWTAVRRGRGTQLAGGLMGVTTALMLYFFVTLDLEPIWIGWRSGQILLVTAPIVITALLVHVRCRLGPAALATVVTMWAVIGMPTTAIDAYNAQDTSNDSFGPGFHWTVAVTPAEREAFEWIQRETAPDAVVQMSLAPRGRETWSLVPSFARRRMAAGLPISLLLTDRQRELAARVDEVFSEEDAGRAWSIAREHGIQYLFVGRVEREAFPALPTALASGPALFIPVFSNTDVTVYAVGCQFSTPCL